MKGFCGAGIFGGLVLVGLGGCSGAAQEASDNTAPVAQEITLSASSSPAYVGTTLQGSYRYADGDGDGENGTLKVWLRDGQPIEGADQDSYTATLQDSGKKLQFRVTPAAATGKSPGAAVLSPEITIENSPPSITGLVISGSVKGQTYTRVELTASYSFQDLDGDSEVGSAYQWFHDGTPPTKIGGATGQAYTVIDADIGKVILVRVTPKDSKNSVGADYVSSAVTVVNKAPVASNVRVNQAGDTLSVTYDYTDHENNMELGSQYRWLRNGVAITDATNTMYTLTLADAGKSIVAEVTPRADTGTVLGLPAISNEVKVATTKVELSVSAGLKQLFFSWYPVTNATYYRVSYNPDGVSGFVLLSPASDNLTATTYDWDIPVHRINWPMAQFMLEACDVNNNCLQSANTNALNVMLGAIGYFKASNTGINDTFGTSVALSADGHTLAVGSWSEASAATGIDNTAPGPADNSASYAGAVYVYTRDSSNGRWSQQAYVKASNTGASDLFGYSLALSGDGHTLAVGAPGEASAATGINNTSPGQADNSIGGAGAVYVYTRNSSSGLWSQQAYVKASNTEASDRFGYSLALSGDGHTLAVGAPGEDSAATGINNTSPGQADNSIGGAGAVYVYTRNSSSGLWSQQAYVKASNTGVGDQFGASLALSADGNTLAVGASGEASAATGIDNTTPGPADNSVSAAGAVYVYTRSSSGLWSQQAYVKASNTGFSDNFGASLALSADGDTLAVGASGEASAATGIDNTTPGPADNSVSAAGAVYVYTRSSSGLWSQQAYVKASNTGFSDNFGASLALSANGDTLAVGAWGEDGTKTAITPGAPSEIDVPNGASGPNPGAAYIFTRSAALWSQQAYVKASNTGAYDFFGASLALSADGGTLAIGASGEASAATGVNNTVPGQGDNTAPNAGAVYLY